MSDDKEQIPVGSPQWRDSQQKAAEELLIDPDHWQFKPTAAQRLQVAEAHAKYTADLGGVPDVSALRSLISQAVRKDAGVGTVKALYAFWTSFSDDMPLEMKSHMGLSIDLQILWAERKIKSIVEQEGLSLMVWTERELVANAKNPNSLMIAAKDMLQAEQEGYSLYHVGMDEEQSEVTWSFRKGRLNLGRITSEAKQ